LGGNIYVRSTTLPETVRAVTLPNDDGTFDIYLNSCLPDELQVRALEHELRHIKLGHFYNDDPVPLNEKEAG